MIVSTLPIKQLSPIFNYGIQSEAVILIMLFALFARSALVSLSNGVIRVRNRFGVTNARSLMYTPFSSANSRGVGIFSNASKNALMVLNRFRLPITCMSTQVNHGCETNMSIHCIDRQSQCKISEAHDCTIDLRWGCLLLFWRSQFHWTSSFFWGGWIPLNVYQVLPGVFSDYRLCSAISYTMKQKGNAPNLLCPWNHQTVHSVIANTDYAGGTHALDQVDHKIVTRSRASCNIQITNNKSTTNCMSPLMGIAQQHCSASSLPWRQ